MTFDNSSAAPNLAEQEYERLFNLSLDILCVSSNDGYFKRVNPAFSRILGWSEAELLSRPYLELVHPDDLRITQQEVDEQTTGAPTLTFENRYRCKNGDWRILSWTSMPQPDGLMFATARDVTELRRAEEELRKSQQDLAITLRSIGDGVIATDARRRITRMNPVAEQLTGWCEEDAVGRPIDDVFVIEHEVTRQPAVIPVDDVLATGTVHGLANHTVLIARDGVERPIADSAAPIRDSAGSISGVVLVFRDASQERELERAHTRAALKTTEDRYRTLLESIPAPVFVYDRESLEYLAVSDQAVALYGYSREEFMEITIADIRPEEDVPALRQMLSQAGTAFEHRGVWRHRKKNGNLIDAEITTHGLVLSGRPACIVLAQDVTEKRRAENALRRSEALNQSILQSSLDGIVTMTEAGEIIEFNRAAEQIFGYTKTQAMGQLVKDLMIPPELRQKHEQGLSRYLSTGEPHIVFKRIRTTGMRSDGQTFPVELTVVPVLVEGERLFTAFLRDLTDIERAERELHRTTELLQAIADGTTDAVFVKDMQGRYLLFNRAAAKLTGRNVDEVLGKNDHFVFGQEHGQIVMENDRLVMHSNQPHIVEEELTASGTTRSYHAMKAPLRDKHGNVIGIIGVSRDISERKQMESALRASEERYRSIVEQSPDMIFVNSDNRISFINQAGLDLLGASAAADVLGRSPLEFFHPDDHAKILQRISQLLSKPGSQPLIEERLVDLTGRIIDVDVQGTSYYSNGELEIQVVCRNVCARKQAEQVLKRHVRHAEFSAAIGLGLSQMPTLSEMLQSCAEAMVTHLDAAYARVWMLNEQENVLELRAGAGACKRLDSLQACVPVGQQTIGRIAAEKSPLLTDTVEDVVNIGDRRWAKSNRLISFAGYPLLIEGRCLGVVAIFARQALDQDLLDYLAMAANGMAQNIERKQAAMMLAELNATLEQRVIERTLELKSSEEFNRATLDALTAHVAVVDRDGRIVATNAAWRKFAADNQVAFQSVSEGANYLAVCDAAAARGDADAAIVADALRDVLSNRRSAWSYEYPCHSPTEQRWFICRVTLGYIRHQPHAVVAHENVSSVKRVQVELRAAKEKADQASLAKSEFLASMSHELRTPLNGILGMNALLQRTELDDRQRRFVTACESSGKILTQLISDVLDLSKIESGKMELDPRQCEIEAVVYDVVDILSSAANQKGISLSCRVSQAACVTAFVDDNRLRQILINLVGNAIKFTSVGAVSIRGDRVELTAGESGLRIEITDTGIGIPQERMDRLFKAFSQVDSSTTRHFGGTGLGLSICHQLINLMGGTIAVESQVGIGSRFWFEIPLQNVARSPRSESQWRSLTGVRVITIGCSDVQRSQIAECMVSWECDCQHAQTLDEVIAIVKRFVMLEFTPVVIAASWRVLENDTVALDQLVNLCHGCVLALAQTQDDISADRYQALGIRRYLSEPVRPSALFETLTSLLVASGSNTAESLPQSVPVSPPSHPLQFKGHLLVAEDNEINRIYIVELLKLLGFSCDLVESGVEVLSALERAHYDLVLMDCQMPEMDGYTAAREIRHREANSGTLRRIPILALTANALKGDRERCLEAGMDDYVKKPIDLANLQTALKQFFSPTPSSKRATGGP